jgi:hypothetical protein
LPTVLLLASPAFAQDDDTDGFYLGAGLGDFSVDTDELDELSDLDDVNLDFDSDESARKAFVGWRFNRFFATQLDIVDFGRSQAGANELRVSTSSEGVAPSIVGTLPLGPVELFLRGGILWYDLSIESNTEVFDDSDRDPVFSTGVGFTVAEKLNLRLEYEVVDIDTFDDAHAVWLNAAWRF